MKDTSLWFSTRYVGFIACFIVCFVAARADQLLTTRPVDSKTRPVPSKHPGLGIKKQQPPASDLHTALQRQIWLAQHKIPVAPKRVRETPVSTPRAPVSRNAERQSLREGLKGLSRYPRGVRTQQLRPRNAARVAPLRDPAQVFGKSRVEADPISPGAEEDANRADQKSGTSGVMLVMIALCAALTGTAGVLYVISKRVHHTTGSKPVRQEVRQKPAAHELPYLIPERKQPARLDSILSEVPEEKADEVVELAQRFQRGQGEMQLMFDLQSHREESVPMARLITAGSPAKAKGGRKKLAGKLGAGKGEAELLIRLQKFQSSAHHAQRML